MKSILTGLIVFIGFSAFSQKYKWEDIKNAPVITTENATSVSVFENTPESVVTYFFASMIRKDKDWEKVVSSPRSLRLKNHLQVYQNDWEFTKFYLVSKTEYQPGHFWVKVYFDVQYGGRTDGGTDEVEVELVDGKWVITDVPV